MTNTLKYVKANCNDKQTTVKSISLLMTRVCTDSLQAEAETVLIQVPFHPNATSSDSHIAT